MHVLRLYPPRLTVIGKSSSDIPGFCEEMTVRVVGLPVQFCASLRSLVIALKLGNQRHWSALCDSDALLPRETKLTGRYLLVRVRERYSYAEN